MISDENHYLLTVGLADFSSRRDSWNLILAGAMITLLPLLVSSLFQQVT